VMDVHSVVCEILLQFFAENVNQSVQKCNHLDTSGIGNNSLNLFNYKAVLALERRRLCAS